MASAEEAAALVGAARGDADALESLVRRREAGEPLAWITGTTTFAGRPLAVVPGVFVPRPHTEVLAGLAAEMVSPDGTAVDLCTGTGAVASHVRAAAPAARVVATDLDPLAVACARANGVPAVVADLDGPLRPGVVDVVTAVPPYVPTSALGLLPRDVVAHEPRPALDGGVDGLEVVARVVTAAARLLRPGGHLLVEIGGDQDGPVAALADRAGLSVVGTWCDEDGDLRGLHAHRPA